MTENNVIIYCKKEKRYTAFLYLTPSLIIKEKKGAELFGVAFLLNF
jgi:hypothetical protein